MAVDFKSLGKNDQGALVTGALAVIFTFFGSYITVSSKAGTFSASAGHNAWDGVGVLGSLLLVVGLAVVVVRIFAAESLPAGVPWNLVTVAAAGLGTIILIIKGLTFGVDVPAIATSVAKIDAGVGWSGWILFILAIAFTVFAALGFKASGEKLPTMGK